MKNLPKKTENDSEKIKAMLSNLRELCSDCKEPKSKHRIYVGDRDKNFFACVNSEGSTRFFEPMSNLDLIEYVAGLI